MKNNLTKQKLIEAASLLFFQKGFNGTTIRDIAGKASVNVSLISYYFKNKQGLLEYTVTHYYESYLKLIESQLNEMSLLTPLEVLKSIVFTIIEYKQMNYQLSCFIHRELSLDSIFVREMTVTYIAKENYLISRPLYSALKSKNRNIKDRHLLFIQLKGMLIAPYSTHNEWEHELISDYSHNHFVKRYVNTIHNWLDFIVLHDSEPDKSDNIVENSRK